MKLILPRRKLVLLAAPAIIGLAKPAPAAWPSSGQPYPINTAPASQLVAHGQAGINQGAFTAIDTTGANALYMAISAGSAPTPSDSKSNTWALSVSDTGVAPQTYLYECLTPTVGTGHTFATTGSNWGFCVAAFKGLAPSPIGPTNHNHTSALTSAGIQPGSVTPSTSKTLFISAWGYATASSSATPDSGYSVTDYRVYIPANCYAVALAYLVQAGLTPSNPTWTTNVVGGIAATALIAAFKST